jgi:hypothetical protein
MNINWKQTHKGAEAVERTDTYVATYNIEKDNNVWIICVSMAASFATTNHGQRFEASSFEKTFEESKLKAEKFRKFMIKCIQEDLKT